MNWKTVHCNTSLKYFGEDVMKIYVGYKIPKWKHTNAKTGIDKKIDENGGHGFKLETLSNLRITEVQTYLRLCNFGVQFT